MCKSELTEFLAELTEFAAELSEFSLPKQYSRNSIPPVPVPLSVSLEKRLQQLRFRFGSWAILDCFFFLWPATQKKPCDFCNRTVASPLLAAVVAAILRHKLCAAKTMSSGRDLHFSGLFLTCFSQFSPLDINDGRVLYGAVAETRIFVTGASGK